MPKKDGFSNHEATQLQKFRCWMFSSNLITIQKKNRTIGKHATFHIAWETSSSSIIAMQTLFRLLPAAKWPKHRIPVRFWQSAPHRWTRLAHKAQLMKCKTFYTAKWCGARCEGCQSCNSDYRWLLVHKETKDNQGHQIDLADFLSFKRVTRDHHLR